MHKAINHCWHMHETSNVFMHICNFLISLWTFGGQLKLLVGQQLYYNSCLNSESKGRLQIQVGWHQPGLNSPLVSTMVPHPTRLPTDDRAACLFTCFTRLRGMGVKATLSHYIVGDSMLNKIVVDHPPPHFPLRQNIAPLPLPSLPSPPSPPTPSPSDQPNPSPSSRWTTPYSWMLSPARKRK